MTTAQAIKFIEVQGVVMEAAQGLRASLVERIAGAPVPGSWWAHPKAKEIDKLLRALRKHKDVLVCRLLAGKVTYVHRRCWPAIVKLAPLFDPEWLAKITDADRAPGKHAVKTTPFPTWVPAGVRTASKKLSKDDAARQLAEWLTLNRYRSVQKSIRHPD